MPSVESRPPMEYKGGEMEKCLFDYLSLAIRWLLPSTYNFLFLFYIEKKNKQRKIKKSGNKINSSIVLAFKYVDICAYHTMYILLVVVWILWFIRGDYLYFKNSLTINNEVKNPVSVIFLNVLISMHNEIT